MLDDGARTIFLSTRWSDDSEVPEGLRKFLEFVKADPADSTKDFADDYVRRLQKSVSRIKSDREMGERYMLLKELLSDEKAEGITIGRARGKAEDVIELLSELGEVSTELSDVIMAEKDPESLLAYLKAASKAESVEKFREEIPRYMVKHQVRPGLTGWAQVNGYRGDTSIRKRIEYDLYYIENWSIGLDIKIIFLTFFKGFINKNAY